MVSLVTWQRGEKEEKKPKQDHNLIVPIFGQFESTTHVKKGCTGNFFFFGKTSNLNTRFTIHRQ